MLQDWERAREVMIENIAMQRARARGAYVNSWIDTWESALNAGFEPIGVSNVDGGFATGPEARHDYNPRIGTAFVHSVVDDHSRKMTLYQELGREPWMVIQGVWAGGA